MPFGYPVFLEMTGRRAVVIGAGAVASGKVEALLSAGADVTVLAEGPAGRLDRLERKGVTVERRAFRPEDLDGAALCVAWSGDPETRAAIHAAATDRGVLVNVMDDVPHCDFASPAVVRRGDLVLAVSTGGGSPALARRVKEELAERFGPEWAEVLEVIREIRRETLPSLPDPAERARRWREALDLEEAAALVRAGRRGELAARLIERLTENGTP